MGFDGKSWLQVDFYSYRSVFKVTGRFLKLQVGFSWFQVGFHVFFMAPSLVFMIPGGFLLSFMVPGWFKFELSAAGPK